MKPISEENTVAPQREPTLPGKERTTILTHIVTTHHRSLYRYFWASTRDHGEAEDLTQEVYFRLARFRDMTELARTEFYLFKIASNLLKNKWRHDRVRHRAHHVDYDDALEKISPTDQIQEAPLEQIIDDRDQCRYLLGVLDRLTPITRDVFMLARFEGMSYAEISDHCGISTHMVKKHMMKAIAQVKTAMER
tara:strand:- start:925 stop:1503 length:579 start_codon:yes stop_codon:yes gene_type:complete